jgi:hypothetical protein
VPIEQWQSDCIGDTKINEDPSETMIGKVQYNSYGTHVDVGILPHRSSFGAKYCNTGLISITSKTIVLK